MAQDDPVAIDDLPALGPEDRFAFSCGPERPCFNACCRDLDLLLYPYDLLRLRAAARLDSETFLTQHCSQVTFPGSGLPMMRLKMTEEEGNPCPFLREEGCSVYRDRPAACRIYPLGRGTWLDEEDQFQERYVLLREPHCGGFEDTDRRWTPAEWTADQGLAVYNRYNDRFTALSVRWQRRGIKLSYVQHVTVALALYQVDNFRELADESGLYDWLDLDPKRRAVAADDELVALSCSFEWVEALLLGER